jgi:hypothetical protein
MICPGGQLQLAHRSSHKAFAGLIQLAELMHLGHAHVGVADDANRVREPRALSLVRRLSTGADVGTGFTQVITTQLLVVHARDFDVDINSVKDGTRDTLLVFGNDNRGTRTGFLGIAKIPAGQTCGSL